MDVNKAIRLLEAITGKKVELKEDIHPNSPYRSSAELEAIVPEIEAVIPQDYNVDLYPDGLHIKKYSEGPGREIGISIENGQLQFNPFEVDQNGATDDPGEMYPVKDLKQLIDQIRGYLHGS